MTNPSKARPKRARKLAHKKARRTASQAAPVNGVHGQASHARDAYPPKSAPAALYARTTVHVLSDHADRALCGAPTPGSPRGQMVALDGVRLVDHDSTQERLERLRAIQATLAIESEGARGGIFLTKITPCRGCAHNLEQVIAGFERWSGVVQKKAAERKARKYGRVL